MELEDIANISQVMKTAAIVIGGGAVGYLFYEIVKEKKRLVEAQKDLSIDQGDLSRAQGALELANELSGKPSYKDLKSFINEEYPSHKTDLEKIQALLERYNEGIFEVEKKGREGDFSTYITKRTTGLIEVIEDNTKKYSAAASFVKNKEKSISNIRIKTIKGDGNVEFPRQLSNLERDALVGRHIAYEEKYSCYDEGAYMGLLQGWHYNIEVLDGPNKGKKLEEDITV